MTAYGFLAGHRMALNHRAEPLAHEITLRYRAQSMLTRNGIVPPLPSIEDAQRILARANRTSRVTVPQPLREPVTHARPLAGDSTSRESGAVQATGHDQCQPVPRQRVPLLPAAAGRAGSNPRDENIRRGIEAMETLERERAAYFAGMKDGPEPPLDW